MEECRKLFYQGLEKFKESNYQKAEEFFKAAHDLEPNRESILINLAYAKLMNKKYEEAIHLGDTLIGDGINEGYLIKTKILFELKKYEEALENIEKIHNKTKSYDALALMAAIMNNTYRFQEAIELSNKALKINQKGIEAVNNKSVALNYLGRFSESILLMEESKNKFPKDRNNYINLSIAYYETKQYKKALQTFKDGEKNEVDFKDQLGNKRYLKNLICDWENWDEELSAIKEYIKDEVSVIDPFTATNLFDSEEDIYKISKYWAKKNNLFSEKIYVDKIKVGKKIKVGLFSADFYNHATFFLMKDYFKKYNKNNFELIAFNYKNNSNNKCTNEVRHAVDKYIDLNGKDLEKQIEIIKNEKLDIAIDLKGYTYNNNVELFKYQLAKIKIGYLGYPGSLGSNLLDYIVADKHLIDNLNKIYFSEKIIYLPDTYQINSYHDISIEKNLAINPIIKICIPNTTRKINPFIMSLWIKILKNINNFHFYILEANPEAHINIIKYFKNNDINESCITFLKKLDYHLHLKRLSDFDLILDTYPYNGHTTTSDALWAGVPVITLRGHSFASRVSSSLLSAIDMPELITYTSEEYVKVAIELATNRKKLLALTKKLVSNKANKNLFNSIKFIKNFENGLTSAYLRWEQGFEPDDIYVKSN